MTNQQAVLAAEAAAKKLLQDYHAFLAPLAISWDAEDKPWTVAQLVECQRLGNAFYNSWELFVANSDLLGAHRVGNWITTFAESCHSILKSYLIHIATLRRHAQYLTQVQVEPDEHAMASMQRMVKAYCTPDKSQDLQQAFTDANLPTVGFIMPAIEDQKDTPPWTIIMCVVIGLLILVASVALVIFFPEPTPAQSFTFRAVLALGLSAVAVGVPGFMNVKARISSFGQYLKFVAGGSIGIFLLVYLVNPPEGYSSPSVQPSIQQPASR
ncbi:hypothetical protein [Pseudomonas protegens]|uniref:hypothetical protein n=1 Tax=Pseudomonas protegens TaxID=380021 RepID=UPI00301D9D61